MGYCMAMMLIGIPIYIIVLIIFRRLIVWGGRFSLFPPLNAHDKGWLIILEKGEMIYKSCIKSNILIGGNFH
jgi:hypothetical protein